MNKIWLVVCALLLNVNMCFASLPDGFVYLDQVDPSIRSSMRCFSDNNFIGQPVEGYNDKKVIMTRAAANALSKAQAMFNQKGYSIVIYDAYRPQTAVNHFMKWSEDPADRKMKNWFYPRVDKSKVFELGYVAAKSGHSRGSTVDISIIKLDQKLTDIKAQPRTLKDGFEFVYLEDGTVDMGSSFDLFDKASHYENDLVGDEHKAVRTFLKETMEAAGFKNYAEEWWHFTLENEPFPDSYIDFKVE